MIYTICTKCGISFIAKTSTTECDECIYIAKQTRKVIDVSGILKENAELKTKISSAISILNSRHQLLIEDNPRYARKLLDIITNALEELQK